MEYFSYHNVIIALFMTQYYNQSLAEYYESFYAYAWIYVSISVCKMDESRPMLPW